MPCRKSPIQTHGKAKRHSETITEADDDIPTKTVASVSVQNIAYLAVTSSKLIEQLCYAERPIRDSLDDVRVNQRPLVVTLKSSAAHCVGSCMNIAHAGQGRLSSRTCSFATRCAR